MGNVIVWADIPVVDLARAMDFYGKVLGRPLFTPPGMDGIGLPLSADGEAGPAFDLYEGGTPLAEGGPTVYLNPDGDINAMVERVRAAGGTVLQEPQFMGDMVGWIAFFLDSEGNRMGIQQPGENK